MVSLNANVGTVNIKSRDNSIVEKECKVNKDLKLMLFYRIFYLLYHHVLFLELIAFLNHSVNNFN